MALHVTHLSQGHTVLCLSVKSATISRYLHAATDIDIRRKLLDHQINERGLKSSCTTKVSVEVKRWESISNRREPVNILMVLHMQAKCAKLYPDSLESALHYWNNLGLCYGFRLSKCAQNFVEKQMPLVNVDSLPIAFNFEDMTFHGAQKHALHQSWSTELEVSKIAFVKLRWCTQKNLNNDEAVSQDRHADLRLCPVLAAHQRPRALSIGDARNFEKIFVVHRQ